MIGKLFLAILIYLGFVMIRGMYRTYKLLNLKTNVSDQNDKKKHNKRETDQNTFEADYKIIK